MPKAKNSDIPPEYETKPLIKRLLFEHALVHWKRYLLAFMLMAVVAACTAAPAYLIGKVVNEAYVNRNFQAILAIGIATALILVMKGVATYGQQVVLSRIGNRIVADNQRRLFGKLLTESLGFYADRHSSEFIARLSTGASSVTQTLNLLITAFGRDLMSLIGLVAVMVMQDPALALITFLVAPPALLVLRKLIRRIRSIARNQFTSGTHILETMQETLQGIRIVKAFTLEDTMRARFDAHVASVEHDANKMARVAARSSPLMESLGGVAIALAFIYGGYRVVETGANPGEFFSFIAAFMLAYEPAKRLARFQLDLNNNLVGVRILYEVIDAAPSEPSDIGKPDLKLADGRVSFDNVHFSYRADEPIMRGMSFMAEPGKMTALVGPSGGGKSTVFNLLLRFYEPTSGTVAIDGQSVTEVSRDSLRRQIGYVGQDTFLFRGSIRENIAFGRPNATQDEIVAAAQAAYAHDFIMGFPNGYDTPVGEHGLQLSGGQRQRIAIARALIKDAHVILLDEATGALDSESERAVQEAIAHLCEGRTTLVIAHRLHTIQHADRILVIEGGTVVEQGRHDELLRKGGRYAAFYRLQLQGQQDPEPRQPLAV
jgi:subfamily B ATP-binding cassette protein MsbA